MTFKLLLAAAIILAAPLSAHAQDFDYSMPSSNLKLVVSVPDGWKKVKDQAAEGELGPHEIDFVPAGAASKSEDDTITITIFPATPKTKPFPEDFHKGLALTSFRGSLSDCGEMASKPDMGTGDLNGFPIAVSYSACWRKAEIVKKFPSRKSYAAQSYFISAYKQSFFIVARYFNANDMGKGTKKLSTKARAALQDKTKEVTNYVMENVALCDTDKTEDACAKIGPHE